jgi:UDP-galactose-lipid carrier transferase
LQIFKIALKKFMIQFDSIKPASSVARTLAAWVCTALLVIADAVAWIGAYKLADPTGKMAFIKFVVMAAAWCAWAAFIHKQYTRRHAFWAELGFVLQGVLMLLFVGSLLKAIIGNTDVLLAWWLACMWLAILLPATRAIARLLLKLLGLWTFPTVLFGGGGNARQAILALRSEADLGYVVRWLVVPPGESAHGDISELGVPVLPWPKTSSDLAVLRTYDCVIALEAHEADLRDKLIRQLSHHQAQYVHVVPAMRGVPLFGLSSTSFFSHEVLMIHMENRLSRLSLRILKRTFDVLCAVGLLLLLSPLFLFLIYKISRDGGRPFFGHERVGQGGKKFACYKFRTMVVNAQDILANILNTDPVAKAEWDKDFKLKNDPRINPIGHFLRRTSIDELPQLWNVLMGDMSLVGPRPVVQSELERYGDDVAYYLMAKPGMTGLWQVSGRNDVDYKTRVYFDSWYVKNWSLWTDVTILFKTITVLARRKGAY